jgi:serine protease AprX
MKILNRLTGFLSLLILTLNQVSAQSSDSFYFYRVYFTDKGDNTSKYTAADLLSPRAIARRSKNGIASPLYSDIPVSKSYISAIAQTGLHLHTTSKWMNTALFKSQTQINLNNISSLPFVRAIKIVKSPVSKGQKTNKSYFTVEQSDPLSWDLPVTMLNAKALHTTGFDGTGILIAVFDGGFSNADKITSLDNLRSRKGITDTYDFVKNDRSVYNSSSHGTAVMSVLAGDIPGFIEGSAPGADYILLKTEDVESEYPCEEDFWAAGAEYADSSGADIISSSLGYFTFDDSTMNHKKSELGGNTAFITQVADIAGSKGILVVNSAGNERRNTWRNIIFPSDGNKVLCVGAVDASKQIASFSSSGLSSVAIKPDIVAMGVNIPVQISDNTGRSSGTSFSCPVISGMAACILQSVPDVKTDELIDLFHQSGDRYNKPDTLYGYGVPDMVKALNILQDKYFKIPDDGPIISPNPTTGYLEILFNSPLEKATITIFNASGMKVSEKIYNGFAGRKISVTALEHSPNGTYFVRIITDKGSYSLKVIKIKSS